MEEFDLFNENLEELEKLFPNQVSAQKWKELRKIFDDTENYWNTNIKRFRGKKIKYLLICEAPPSTGKYFYIGANTPLFKLVWKTFYSNPASPNQNDAYKCLADLGFLLVDTLLFTMNYTRLRKKPAYDALIKSCLPWWINKLNSNFTFAPDLKIAFGFKLNAQSLIKATGGTVCLGGKNYKIHNGQIAADKNHRWQPSTANLERIFQIASKQICHRCP